MFNTVAEELLQQHQSTFKSLANTQYRPKITSAIIKTELNSLLQLKHEVIEARIPPRMWPEHFLSHSTIKNFLIWVIKQMEMKKFMELITLIQEIINPIDLTFMKSDNKSTIQQILCGEQFSTNEPPLSYEYILDYFSIVKRVFFALAPPKNSKRSLINKANAESFTYVEQLTDYYKSYMKKAKQKHDILFLDTLLISLGYNPVKNKFEAMYEGDFAYLNNYLDKYIQDYFKISAINTTEHESFIIKIGIGLAVNHPRKHEMIKQINHHIFYIKEQLGITFSSQINYILEKFCTSGVYDFEKILEQLRNDDLLEDNNKSSNGASTNTACCGLKSGINASGNEEKGSNLQNMLNYFGFMEKYNQKLTFSDALVIRHEIPLSEIEPANLVFVIMNKIMACDRKCRSILFPYTIPKDQYHISDEDTEEVDNLSSSSESEEGCVKSKFWIVHPLDIIILLIHCSDNLLRYELFSKLFSCQIAVPLLLPDTIQNSVTLLLWALRSVKKSWKFIDTHGKVHSKTCSIVDHKGAIVSFLKCGKALQTSKSELINKVIGGEDIFFHRDLLVEQNCCKIISQGVVELSCYYPSKKDSVFKDAVIFTNLHGNASHYPKQVAFIKPISFISCILIQKKNLGKKMHIDVIKELTNCPGGVIIIITDSASYSKDRLLKTINQTINHDAICVVNLKNKTSAAIQAQLRQLISHKLEVHSYNFTSIADFVDIARKCDIKVDEDNENCMLGKIAAQGMKQVINKVEFTDIKRDFLPLQGPTMWQKWAAHEKEHHRHKERKHLAPMEYKMKKEKQKDEIRFNQFKYINSTSLSPLTKVFMQNILWCELNSHSYFYQWLKMELDNLSRDILQDIQIKYRETKSKIETVSSTETETIKELKELSRKQNIMLINASVGIEHFFREIGQIYETVLFKKKHESSELLINFHRNEIEQLPRIAAKALVEGFAMEIMDGEASHIPLTWVRAVIRSLQQMYKNKRFFVLSILGVQSSGKSTLLNTMFGLRFNVSVARCTRGAFIQIVEIDQELRNELHCDFIMVVDTEGICAPELLIEGSDQHDNELATFVIGLADFTIINIYGETPANLTDILQTVLHAFIRMKEVEKNPGCLFVHQNVTEQFATDSLQPGKQILLDQLNSLTQAIAKIECCEANYLKFQDVIKFDVNKDVYYFSSLWKGDPPMAPVNIGYSECAQDLKKAVLKLIKGHQNFCTFELFEERIHNLWTAVLKENFIFSFKNTMEVIAYSELDLKYGKWCWKLQEVLVNQLLSCENKIKSCGKEDVIDNIRNACSNDSIKILNGKCDELCKEVANFIAKHDLAKIMSKWAFDYKDRLLEKKKMFIITIKQHCKRLVHKKENDRKNEELQQQYEEKLREEITELVSELGTNKTADSEEISEMFDANWSKWIAEFRKKVTYLEYPSDEDIDRCIESSLGNNFEADYSSLIEKMEEYNLNDSEESSLFMTVENKHISVKRSLLYAFSWIKYFNNHILTLAQEETDKIFESIRKLVKSITETKKEGVTPNLPDWILSELMKDINNFNDHLDDHNFSFTSQFKIDIALVVCRYAAQEFKQWTKKLKEQNDPILPLQQQKSKFLTIFTNKYHNVASEIAAAEEFCNSLIESIVSAAINKLHVSLVSYLKTTNGNFNSKPGLKVQVLTDLANDENFNAYKVYLKNSNVSLKDWAEKYILNLCSSKNESDKSPFQNLAIQEINSLLHTITEAVEVNEISFGTEWLNMFCTTVDGTIEIKRYDWNEDVKSVSNNLDSMKHFTINLIKDLNSEHSKEVILNKIHLKTTKICKAAGSLLYDSVISSKCTVQCPFCSEQCDIINNNHLNHDPPKLHHVRVHRPQCVNNVTWYKSNKLVVDVCNSLVDSTCNLVLIGKDPTGNTRIPYKDYQKEYPEWDIPGETIADPPMYWMWFVSHFYKDLVAWSEAVETDVPISWKEITKSKAIDSLAQTYGVYYAKDN